jgi:hypothetical protein
MIAALDAVEATKPRAIPIRPTEIRTLDAIAAARIMGCAREHAITFNDLEQFSGPHRTAQVFSWASNATGCAMQAREILRVVTDKAAIEDIGLAIGVIYPLTIDAHARAGLHASGLVDSYRDANQIILAKSAPADAEAAPLTSRAVALAVLPTLKTISAQLAARDRAIPTEK